MIEYFYIRVHGRNTLSSRRKSEGPTPKMKHLYLEVELKYKQPPKKRGCLIIFFFTYGKIFQNNSKWPPPDFQKKYKN